MLKRLCPSSQSVSLSATPVLVGAAYAYRIKTRHVRTCTPLGRGYCHVSAVMSQPPLAQIGTVYGACACLMLAHGGELLWRTRHVRGVGAAVDLMISTVHIVAIPAIAGTTATFAMQGSRLHLQFAKVLLGCASCLTVCAHASHFVRHNKLCFHGGTAMAVACALIAPMLSSLRRPINTCPYIQCPSDNSIALAAFELLLLGSSSLSYNQLLSSRIC